jgi:hypothetical protein
MKPLNVATTVCSVWASVKLFILRILQNDFKFYVAISFKWVGKIGKFFHKKNSHPSLKILHFHIFSSQTHTHT